MTDPDFPLDDPDYSAFAWRRFRKLLGWMALVAAVAGAAAVAILRWWLGFMPLSMGLATGFGIFFTIMMAAALMGLIFLSSGTGHDEQVDAFNKERTSPFDEDDQDQSSPWR